MMYFFSCNLQCNSGIIIKINKLLTYWKYILSLNYLHCCSYIEFYFFFQLNKSKPLPDTLPNLGLPAITQSNFNDITKNTNSVPQIYNPNISDLIPNANETVSTGPTIAGSANTLATNSHSIKQEGHVSGSPLVLNGEE